MKLPFMGKKPSPSGPNESIRQYRRGDFIGGKFEVLRSFEGGLGTVYVVTDGSTPFVLKTPKHSLNTGDIDGFKKEARAWIHVGHHENIVPALWVDEIAGLVFVAAELIEPDVYGGVTLRDVLRRTTPTVQQIFRWSAEFCYGMQHASTRGIKAHRDIKPENLLLGARNVLQVTDFGLASVVGDRMGSNTSEISGTPPYMAPEQWLGGQQAAATDIYAFGVVLHELCFGRLPWNFDSLAALRNAHLKQAVRPPSHPLSALIIKCLDKTPSGRPSSFAGLLEALAKAARDVNLRLPPAPQPISEEREELFALASTEAIGDLDSAHKAAEALVSRWPQDARAWTQLGRVFYQSGRLVEARDATQRSLAIDPTRSAPWNNLGLILNAEGDHAASIEALKRALDADADNTGAMLNLTKPLRAKGRIGEAVQHLRHAASLAPDKYSIWTNLGSTYADLDMIDDAIVALERALTLAPLEKRTEIEALIEHYRRQPRTAHSGAALLTMGRSQEALKRLREEASSEPNNPVVAQNLALALLKNEHLDEARRALDRLHQLEPYNDFAWMNLLRLETRRRRGS